MVVGNEQVGPQLKKKKFFSIAEGLLLLLLLATSRETDRRQIVKESYHSRSPALKPF
jgi:uncharacterized membrane protein